MTPNYNMGEYLEDTICSILDQGYPNLEYIIIDGGSVDASVDIIKKYETYLAYWTSEPDEGMYHAIQKGFEKSTGEIMGWLNSDDMLHDKSLYTIGQIFLDLPEVRWIQGYPTFYDERGRTVNILSDLRVWSKYYFYLGHYQAIQQESTFWRRSLWDEAGGTLNQALKYAGDFELWLRFFRYAKLYNIHALVGGFRVRPEQQLSAKNRQKYREEVQKMLKQETSRLPSNIRRNTLWLRRMLKLIHLSKKLKFMNSSGLERKFIKSQFDLPERIVFSHSDNKFFLK